MHATIAFLFATDIALGARTLRADLPGLAARRRRPYGDLGAPMLHFAALYVRPLAEALRAARRAR